MQAPKPFPTDEPIRPEERLVGRQSHLDVLEDQVVRRRINTRLAGPRRIGKTSVGQAICDRARRSDGWWVLEADLSKHGPLREAGALAQHIAAGARTARIRISLPQAGTLRRFAHKAAEIARKAPSTGVEEVDAAMKAAAMVDAALAPKESSQPEDLRNVLEAIRGAARASGRSVLLFIDEAQRLVPRADRHVSDWSTPEDSELVQNVLAEIMRDAEPRIVVLIAGSETRLMESLFADGAPMEHLGTAYDLPDIGREDWLAALQRRFADEVRLPIRSELVNQILDATGGHPQATMQVCEGARSFCENGVDTEITDLAVENAIRDWQAPR